MGVPGPSRAGHGWGQRMRRGVGQAGTARAAGGVTLGVEEEFVLLDPATGAAVLAAPDLVAMLGGGPGVKLELMQFQVDTATGYAPAWRVSAASWPGCGGWPPAPRRAWAAA